MLVTPKKNGEFKIVTSFYPIYIETINVTKGIDGVVVENMTKPQTGCLHDYQMTPADMKKLENADVFVANGAGMEAFLDDIINEQKQLYVIDSSANIPLLVDEHGEKCARMGERIQQHNAGADNSGRAEQS